MVTRVLDLFMPGSYPIPSRMEDILLTIAGSRANCPAWAKMRPSAACLLIEDNWASSG